jgi:hypothetical protein
MPQNAPFFSYKGRDYPTAADLHKALESFDLATEALTDRLKTSEAARLKLDANRETVELRDLQTRMAQVHGLAAAIISLSRRDFERRAAVVAHDRADLIGAPTNPPPLKAEAAYGEGAEHDG